MTGIGRSGGAGTVINAMATGRGVAFGLDFHVTARVDAATKSAVRSNGAPVPTRQARLALLSARQVTAKPLRIAIRSDIPPERGLKSSSAVSIAVIRATLAHVGKRWSDQRILRAAAAAGIRSGTSLTGAFDDAAACLLGGTVYTDNHKRRLLRRTQLPGRLVALINPGTTTLATSAVLGTNFEPVRALVTDAERLAREGLIRDAMLLNTAAYAPLFGHEARFTADAIRAGAYAAGLSGKGPAEIALAQPAVAQRLRRTWKRAFVVPLRNRRAA